MAGCAVLAGCHNHSGEEGHDHEAAEESHHHHHDEADGDHDHGEAEEEHGHEGHSHDGEIEVSLEKQKAFGITVDTVKAGEFAEVIHTSGQILSAVGDEVTIVATSDGIVSLGRLTEGSAVGKGTVVAGISSRNLDSGDRLAKVRAAYEAARKEYERDVQLSKDNIVSESHLDQSKLAYEQAKAEYDAIARTVSKDGAVSVTSPMAGFVKKLCVGQGDYVQTGTPIAIVSQNRRLRLRADVSEKYYPLLAGVKDANFKTSYSDKVYSLKELNGRVVSYGKASDGDYYVPVTFEFDNKGDLVAGSYVEIFLKSSNSAEAVSVPVGAVVEDQGVHSVFVQHDETGFLKREVTLGQSDGERALVKSGLAAGDVVVVTGAVQVKLSSVTAVPAGHTHNH